MAYSGGPLCESGGLGGGREAALLKEGAHDVLVHIALHRHAKRLRKVPKSRNENEYTLPFVPFDFVYPFGFDFDLFPNSQTMMSFS